MVTVRTLLLLALLAASLAAAVALLTAAFLVAVRLVAARRRRRFLPALGAVVRIATPCAVVDGLRRVPGTLALVPEGLVWDAPLGLSGRLPFDDVKRLEVDRTRDGALPLVGTERLLVTLDSGARREFVVSKADAWEWRRALGEWVGSRGSLSYTAPRSHEA